MKTIAFRAIIFLFLLFGIDPVYGAGKERYFTCDMLNWSVSPSGTSFACTTSSASPQFPLGGKTQDFDSKWKRGVRIGAQERFNYDGWDLKFQFTFYRAHLAKEVTRELNQAIVPLKGSVVVTTVERADSSYFIDFYNYDLELGRKTDFTPAISFRPFIGIKRGDLKQTQESCYFGGSLGDNSFYRVKESSDYWGMGAKGGIETWWQLGNNWYIDALVSNTFLYGSADIKYREQRSSSSGDVIDIETKDRRITPVTHWRLGLGWGNRFLNVRVAYEGSYWWQHNQMMRMYECRNLRYEGRGDSLSLQGVTFSTSILF